MHFSECNMQDGRLRQDDRLIEANGHSLLGLSNTEAMNVLRFAMESDGPEPGTMGLVIARDKASRADSNNQYDGFSKLYEQPSGMRKEAEVDTYSQHKEHLEKYCQGSKFNCPQSLWAFSQKASNHQCVMKETTTDANAVQTKENSCVAEHHKNNGHVQVIQDFIGICMVFLLVT